MRQTEKEFALVFSVIGLLFGMVVGFSIAHLPKINDYICPPPEPVKVCPVLPPVKLICPKIKEKECPVCDRSDCLE